MIEAEVNASSPEVDELITPRVSLPSLATYTIDSEDPPRAVESDKPIPSSSAKPVATSVLNPPLSPT